MPFWTLEALKEHFDTRLADLDQAATRLREADREGVKVALAESKGVTELHNGLIRQMRDQQADYATKDSQNALREALERRLAATERFNAKITGAPILVGAIGVANLVKVWTN